MSARSHTRRTIVLALGISLLGFLGAGTLAPVLHQRRIDEKLLFHDPSENLPPELLAGKLLGSVRGWLINYLWIRASDLQDAGQFHESLELMKATTKLQPHFARVWGFQGSLMYMNLSKSSYSREERWYWIEEGVRLLYEGVEYNPYSRLLHHELAWLFTGRIEPTLDRHNAYYKRRFAEEWHQLLGPPPSECPRAAFVAWLREVVADASGLRGRLLRERYRMDPVLMLDLTETLGPIDWRHPAAHALYWATQGELRSRSRSTQVRIATDEDRYEVFATGQVRRALGLLLGSGRLRRHTAGDQPYYTRSPEPALAEAHALSLRVIFPQEPGSPDFDADAPYNRTYQDLLEPCVETLWIHGQRSAAGPLYARLTGRFPTRSTGSPYPELSEFPRFRVLDDIEAAGRNREQETLTAEALRDRRKGAARAALLGLVQRGFSDGLANGSEQIAAAWTGLAWSVLDECLERGILTDTDFLDPEYKQHELQSSAFRAFLEAPPALASPFAKARLWHAAPPEFKRPVYEQVKKQVRFELEQEGLDPDLAFPPPDAPRPPPE